MKKEKLSMQKIRKMKTTNTGITLVALVVTIVVLLILAGITITYVMGDNSIIRRAQDAKNKMDDAILNEQEGFEQLENMLKDGVQDIPKEDIRNYKINIISNLAFYNETLGAVSKCVYN